MVVDTNAAADDKHRHPWQSFQDIQLALVKAGLLLPLQILPNEHSLLGVLKAYTASPYLQATAQPAAPIPSVDVLPYCSLESPMSKATFMALSDTFSTLRDLAKLGVDEQAVEDLRQIGLSEEQAGACVSFWVEEWLPE